MKRTLTYNVGIDYLRKPFWSPPAADPDTVAEACDAVFRVKAAADRLHHEWLFPSSEVTLPLPIQTDFDAVPPGYLEGSQNVGCYDYYEVDFERVYDIEEAFEFEDWPHRQCHRVKARPKRDVILKPGWTYYYREVTRYLEECCSNRYAVLFIVSCYDYDAYLFRFDCPTIARDFRKRFERHETGLAWDIGETADLTQYNLR